MDDLNNNNFENKINDYLIFKEDLNSLNKDMYVNEKEIINWSFVYRKLLKNIINNVHEITTDEIKIKISILKYNIKNYQLKVLNSPNKEKEKKTSSQIVDYFTYILKKKKSNLNDINLQSFQIKSTDDEKSNIKSEKQKIISQKKNFPLNNYKNKFEFGLDQLNILNNVYESYNSKKKGSSKNIFNERKSKSPFYNFNNENNNINNDNLSKKSEKTLERTISTKNKTSITFKRIFSKNKEKANVDDYYFELKGGNDIKLHSHNFLSDNKHNLIFKKYLEIFNNREKDLDPSFNSEFYSGLFNFNNLIFDENVKNLNEDQELQRARLTCDNILTKFNPSIKKESNLINIEKYK